MIDLKAYEKVFEMLPYGIKEAEADAEKISKITLHIKDGKLIGSKSQTHIKLYVRATGERTGMVYTENLDDNPIDVLKKAIENSKYSSVDTPAILGGTNTIHLVKGIAGVRIDSAVDFGVRAEKFALDNECVDSINECTIIICTREQNTVNSLGLKASYEAHWVESLLGLSLKREQGYAPGNAYISKASIDEIKVEELVNIAISDGQAYDGGGLKPCEVGSGSYDAVLSGRVMRNILMTAWRTLAGNAMQAGETIFTDTPGAIIGSNALNIINTPSHSMLGQAWLVDSEGTLCEKTKLVENGTLITPLHTLETGKKASMPSTGSAGRVDRMTGETPIKITTVPAILYVKKGECSSDELIQKMDTGFLLTYSLDLFHSVNVANGEFSIPCGGLYYKNGKPVGSVSQMTIAGNIKDLFLAIEAVADDLDFDDFYLRSYTIGSPSTLVRGLKFGS